MVWWMIPAVAKMAAGAAAKGAAGAAGASGVAQQGMMGMLAGGGGGGGQAQQPQAPPPVPFGIGRSKVTPRPDVWRGGHKVMDAVQSPGFHLGQFADTSRGKKVLPFDPDQPLDDQGEQIYTFKAQPGAETFQVARNKDARRYRTPEEAYAEGGRRVQNESMPVSFMSGSNTDDPISQVIRNDRDDSVPSAGAAQARAASPARGGFQVDPATDFPDTRGSKMEGLLGFALGGGDIASYRAGVDRSSMGKREKALNKIQDRFLKLENPTRDDYRELALARSRLMGSSPNFMALQAPRGQAPLSREQHASLVKREFDRDRFSQPQGQADLMQAFKWLEDKGDLDMDDPDIWSKLLLQNSTQSTPQFVKDTINSFFKAYDPIAGDDFSKEGKARLKSARENHLQTGLDLYRLHRGGAPPVDPNALVNEAAGMGGGGVPPYVPGTGGYEPGSLGGLTQDYGASGPTAPQSTSAMSRLQDRGMIYSAGEQPDLGFQRGKEHISRGLSTLGSRFMKHGKKEGQPLNPFAGAYGMANETTNTAFQQLMQLLSEARQ